MEYGFPVQNEPIKTLEHHRYAIERSPYYRGALNEILKAVTEDGVRFGWSFWVNNKFYKFLPPFGMQVVNRTNGLLTRHFKRNVFLRESLFV